MLFTKGVDKVYQTEETAILAHNVHTNLASRTFDEYSSHMNYVRVLTKTSSFDGPPSYLFFEHFYAKDFMCSCAITLGLRLRETRLPAWSFQDYVPTDLNDTHAAVDTIAFTASSQSSTVISTTSTTASSNAFEISAVNPSTVATNIGNIRSSRRTSSNAQSTIPIAVVTQLSSTQSSTSVSTTPTAQLSSTSSQPSTVISPIPRTTLPRTNVIVGGTANPSTVAANVGSVRSSPRTSNIIGRPSWR